MRLTETKIVIGEPGGQLRLACTRAGCNRISSWFEFNADGSATLHFRNRHDNETHEHVITGALLSRVLDVELERRVAACKALQEELEALEREIALRREQLAA